MFGAQFSPAVIAKAWDGSASGDSGPASLTTPLPVLAISLRLHHQHFPDCSTHCSQAPSHRLCPSPTHICTCTDFKMLANTYTADVTATPCPSRLYASKCRQSVYDPCISRFLLRGPRASWGGELKQMQVRGYSTSCLFSPWLNHVVQVWQNRSCLLSFNNLCCLTKPAKSRIT